MKEKKMLNLKWPFVFVATVIAPLLILSGCGKSKQTNNLNQKDSPEYSQVVTAPHNLITDVLNTGYKLSGDVYTTRSKDYKKVYFIGAIVISEGKKYKCIWSSDNIEPNAAARVMFSMNSAAEMVSGLGDGRTNKNPLSWNDDGYQRIMDKLEQVQ